MIPYWSKRDFPLYTHSATVSFSLIGLRGTIFATLTLQQQASPGELAGTRQSLPPPSPCHTVGHPGRVPRWDGMCGSPTLFVPPSSEGASLPRNAQDLLSPLLPPEFPPPSERRERENDRLFTFYILFRWIP